MNFTAVRGFNAYAMFSAKIREAVKSREEPPEEPAEDLEYSRSIYSEPIDTVTISEPARNASAALAAAAAAEPEKEAAQETQGISRALTAANEHAPYTQFREWLRTTGIGEASGIMSGGFTHEIPGSIMNDALLGSGISVSEDEEYSVSVDMLSVVTVSSRNAEKAKAIQDLLSSTPAGINWGLLLATLPPR